MTKAVEGEGRTVVEGEGRKVGEGEERKVMGGGRRRIGESVVEGCENEEEGGDEGEKRFRDPCWIEGRKEV